MGHSFDGLFERTSGLIGDFVRPTVQKVQKALVKKAIGLGIGLTGMILGLVFGLIAAIRGLELLIHNAWAPPLIVSGVGFVVGFVGLKMMGSGKKKCEHCSE